jgi:hypothetical protein
MKISPPPVGEDLFHAGRRMDRQTDIDMMKLIFAFAKAPKMICLGPLCFKELGAKDGV